MALRNSNTELKQLTGGVKQTVSNITLENKVDMIRNIQHNK